MKPRLPRHPAAFSLLEILVALGLFAIAIAGLLALFPIALHSDKESEEETRSLFIASGVMEALNSGEGHGIFQLATGMSNSVPVLEILSPSKNSFFFIAYNTSCEPIRKLTASEAELPVNDPNASAIVTLALISKPPLPGLLTAEVTIASPASAPASGRSTKHFTRLVAVPLPSQ